MPNFFVIGSARCATESIYSYLEQHPQIYMSPTKETNWFVFYGNEIPYCGPGDWETLRSRYVADMAAYQKLFSSVKDELAIGEASPLYIYCPDVAKRIRKDVPDAKIIAMLRNPIDRAYSAFGWLHISQRETVGDFGRALDMEDERIASNWEPIWHYRSMGMYYSQVKRYFDEFGPEAIRIYLYDDFLAAPQAVMREMLEFLQVDDTFVPDMSIRWNQSYVPRSPELYRFMAGRNPFKEVLKPFLPSVVRDRLRQPMSRYAVGRVDMVPEVRHRLLAAFRDDTLKVQDLIKRDLTRWLAG